MLGLLLCDFCDFADLRLCDFARKCVNKWTIEKKCDKMLLTCFGHFLMVSNTDGKKEGSLLMVCVDIIKRLHFWSLTYFICGKNRRKLQGFAFHKKWLQANFYNRNITNSTNATFQVMLQRSKHLKSNSDFWGTYFNSIISTILKMYWKVLTYFKE